MDKETFQVIFEGQLTGDYDITQVKTKLASLFKMNAQQVEALFTGKTIVIKRNVDKQVAQKYAEAMKKAGAVCQIIEPPKPSASTDTTTKPVVEQEIAKKSVAATTRDIVNLKVPDDLSDISMAAAGEILVTAKDQVQPEFADISSLELITSDTPLIPPSEIVEPEIEISGLSVETISD